MHAFIVLIAIIFSLSPVNAKELPRSETQIKLSFAPVVKEVAPAVVNIYAKQMVQQRMRSPFMGDPFFERFFGGDLFGRRMRERASSALGSGFIIDEKGLVVTNAHVIKNATDIAIHLQDGRQYSADISLIDEPSDIALLRIDLDRDETLPAIDFEPSETLEVGDLVIAIGNPFGVGQTVTSGIVSAVARAASSISDFNFFIQTDAAINPGNSGGPLVSLNGKVVGVNTAIYSRDGGSLGIGFAVPSEMAATVIAAEKSGQTNSRGIVRPWIGMTGQTLTPDLADALGLSGINGVVINDIHAKGPAAKSGIRQSDVITGVNGHAITSPQELKFRFATIPLGAKVQLSYIRNGQKRETSFTAMAAIEDPEKDERTLEGNHPFNGITVVNVSPSVQEELSLKEQDEGVVIYKAPQRRGFSSVSLREGDGIIEVNGTKISSVKQFQKMLKRISGSQGWDIVLRRNGRNQRIIMR